MPAESDDVRMEYTGLRADEVRAEFDYFGYCMLTERILNPTARRGWPTCA